MDWQDSGASPLPLSDEELVKAIATLSTEQGIQLLIEQQNLRQSQINSHSESAAEASIDENLQSSESVAQPQENKFPLINGVPEESTKFEGATAEAQVQEQPLVQPVDHVAQLSFEEALGVIPEPIDEVEIAFESEPVDQKDSSSTDVAAALNALYGVASVSTVDSTEVENNTVASKAETIPAVSESNLVDDLILQFGGEADEEPQKIQTATNSLTQPLKASGRSVWSLISNWSGTGALVAAMAIGYFFASSGNSLGSLLLGGFVGFVILGFIFAFSALAARRGRAMQLVLARAAFGVSGNIIPSSILILARVLALAVAILLFAIGAKYLFPAANQPQQYNVDFFGISTVLPAESLTVVVLAVLILIFGLIRGRAIEVTRIVVAAMSLIAIVTPTIISEFTGTVAYRGDLSIAYPAALGLASSLIVVFGLLFGTSSSDEIQNLRADTSIPKFVAAGLLNWLITGTIALTAGFVLAKQDLTTPTMLFLAGFTAIILFVGLTTIFTGTVNQFLGLRISKPSPILKVLLGLVVMAFAIFLDLSTSPTMLLANITAVLPLAGIPVAAWLGIFTMDTIIRKTDFHMVSLDKNYGFYGGWNLANLLGWLYATAMGFGLIQSNLSGFTWVGYLAVWLPISDSLLTANLGVWVALAIGLLVPLVMGIHRIRNQEEETIAIAARRTELAELELDGN